MSLAAVKARCGVVELPPEPSIRLCKHCGAEHDGSYWWAEFCSSNCRFAAEGRPTDLTPTAPTRVDIAPLFNRPESTESDQSAEIEEYRPDNERAPQNGPRELSPGRRLNGSGYVNVRTDTGWMAEHRAVMEQVLGRRLRLGESVHHKNGIRHDNRPENLELWIGPIRRGVRARDFHCPHCGEPWVYPEEPGA